MYYILFKGTKGAVSVRFNLYGESFCFVNNHFVAGEDYCLQRNNVSFWI